MKKIALSFSGFVLSAVLSSAFAAITLSPSSSQFHPIAEFTGKLVEITYCSKNVKPSSPCYQAAGEELIRANIKSDSGSNVLVDFTGTNLAFGEKLIPLIGKKIHAKFLNNSEYRHEVEYLNITE